MSVTPRDPELQNYSKQPHGHVFVHTEGFKVSGDLLLILPNHATYLMKYILIHMNMVSSSILFGCGEKNMIGWY